MVETKLMVQTKLIVEEINSWKKLLIDKINRWKN